MDYHLDVAHTLPEGDTEEGLIGEHFIEAGLIEVRKVNRPDVEYGPRELEVQLIGEPHALLDWCLNYWNGPGEGYPAGTHARLDLSLVALKDAKPGRG